MLSMLRSDLVFRPQQVSPTARPKNLPKHLYTQYVQNLIHTETRLQKSLETKPCVQIGHMSNQHKAEFINNIFHIQSFWGGHSVI
jgi:hypothetical protein